jgi:hypothetical protein
LSDIFDQVAAPSAAASSGDIFDQVAAKTSGPEDASSAAPASPNGSVLDYTHPAGISGAAPALPSHPVQLPPALDPNLEDKAARGTEAQMRNFGSPVRRAFSDIGSGAQDIYGAAKQDFENSGGNPFVKLPEDVAKQNRDKAFGGAAKLISGGGTLAVGMEAPAVLNVAAKAVAGDVAAKVALAKIVGGVAAGTGASAAGGAVADKYQVSPGAKNLIQAVSFFVPSLMGIVAGVKTDVGPDIQGRPAASVSAFGGKVRAGVVADPEAFAVGGRVGDVKAGVRIPRGQTRTPAPDPAQVLSAEQADAGTNAIVRATTKAEQAAQMVAGGPPPPPPGPPMPDGMASGVISQQIVHDIAAAINVAPTEQHPQLLMEAHGNLANYIQKQGRIIGPGGKLSIADTPQQAAKLAQNIINDEVDRQHQAKEESTKQQEEAAKVATTPTEDGGLSPAEMQWQRAKTLIESTTPKPGQTIESVLERSLGVSPDVAAQMVDRHAKETEQAAIPTVGSKKEPVVEESRATVDAQVDALRRGDINVVMIPAGATYRPSTPEGMKLMAVRGDAPGAGYYIYNPTRIQAATIKTAAKAGTHGDLLGHVQSKADLAAEPEKPTVVVQAQGKDGTPIQDSEVHPERIPDQVEAMQERHPDAKVVVKQPDEVIADRVAAQGSEQKPEERASDIFDQVAEPEEMERASGASESEKGGELSEKNPELSAGEVSGATEPTPAAKYENGSTQADIAEDSDAGRALADARSRIDPADLSATGYGGDQDGLEREPHVTVRYGIRGDDLTGIREYLKQQAPFEAHLGKTESFPPSKGSDGAAVIQAPVNSLELHRINEEIEKHGDFKPSDFPDYKPHATIAYVKPEAAKKYVGMDETDGRSFRVDSVTISDRNGKKEVVKLEGKPSTSADVKKAEQTPAESANEHVEKHLPVAVAEYIHKNTAGGTLTISSDAARELLPGYSNPAERLANNYALGPASSKLANSVWNEVMKRGPQEGRPVVEFLTGSPGSGKTSSFLDAEEDGPVGVISEGMMDSFEMSERRIQQSIDSGFVPTLRLVYADDPRITLRRAVSRAAEYGRPVRIAQMARLYVDMPHTVEKLARHFGDGLGVTVFDNSIDGKPPKEVSLDHALDTVGAYTKETAKEALQDELDKLRDSGRISPEAYDKFADANHSAAGSENSGGPGDADDERSDRKDQPRRKSPRAVEPAAQPSIKKGDTVDFIDLKGVKRTGVVAHTGGLVTRIKSEGREYTTPTRKVTLTGASTSSTSNEVEKQEVAAQPEAEGAREVDRGDVGTSDVGDLAKSNETDEGTKYLHGGLGIAADALKPLAQVKPIADIAAFLGDEAERVAVSRDLHNRLYDMASQDNAAVLRAVQMLKAMPGTAKDQQAIYHHLEDPDAVTLTPKQEEILDEYLTPLIYQAEHDFQVVTEGGVPLDNYVHRQVRDRGGMIDRIMERVKEKAPVNGVGGGRLTKTAPAQKHRTMMAAIDSNGRRMVVSIKGREVTGWKNGSSFPMGRIRPADAGVQEYYDKHVMDKLEKLAADLGIHHDRTAKMRGSKLGESFEGFSRIRTKAGSPEQVILHEIGHQLDDRYDLQKEFVNSPDTREELRKLADLRYEGQDVTPNYARYVRKGEEKMAVMFEAYLHAPERFREVAPNTFSKFEKFLDAHDETRPILDIKPSMVISGRKVGKEQREPDEFIDNNGKKWKIAQATTKEIEANTEIRYYQNAAASVVVNYLAMDKARRAYDFLEEFKRSPEFAEASHSINTPGAIPKGWKATQLPQFRGHFFEPHIAEVLDAYARKAVHDPGVLEKVGNFLRTSIFFNPLIHVPNLVNHWAVEKGVSGFVNPMNYPRMTRAGIKAINAVIHQNADFLEALDAGAPLQSQQFETKQFADLFFKKMQEELGDDPESDKVKEWAKTLGMSPVRFIKSIYDLSSKVTWYTNDIAFLQAVYEKQERGMSLKDALTETSRHIPDYRLMTRIFDSPNLAKLMSNKNITMFGAYHYGALKSYGQMAKSLTGFNWTDAGTKNEQGEPTNAAGRTEQEEKLHGLDTLAMLALTTFVIYPLIDRLLKAVTGNTDAQMRRAGASTFIYNLAMLSKAERTPTEVAESVATPAVHAQASAEMVMNRDLRTGQRLYDPHAPAKKLAGQVGRQLVRSVAPVSQGMDIAEGRTDVKRLAYSMLGVSFPKHGAEKIAAMITAERLSSLPPRSEDEIAHAIERSRALHDAWAGDRSKLDVLLRGKDFTAKEKAKIRKDYLLPPIVYAVRGMNYDDALKVYRAADEQQRRQLRPMMSRKLANLLKAGKKPDDVLGKDDDD